MKKHLLTSAAVLGLFAGAAAATPFTDQVVTGLQAQGFDHIQIVEGSTQLKVEAIRGTTTFEIIYDLATGTVLKQETGTVEAGTDATPGVEIATEDGDFVDPADTGTGADDNSTDAPEDSSSDGSEDNATDGADDNSGSETDKQSGHADVAPTDGSDTPSMDDSTDDTPDQATDDSATDDSATDDTATDDTATDDTATDDTSDDSATDDTSDDSQDDSGDDTQSD